MYKIMNYDSSDNVYSAISICGDEDKSEESVIDIVNWCDSLTKKSLLPRHHAVSSIAGTKS
jgi:hypothetical protein